MPGRTRFENKIQYDPPPQEPEKNLSKESTESFGKFTCGVIFTFAAVCLLMYVSVTTNWGIIPLVLCLLAIPVMWVIMLMN